MCFKFGAANSGQEFSSEKAKPFEVIPRSDYIPVDVEKRRGFVFRGAKDGASGGDGFTTELLSQGGWEGRGQSTVTGPYRRYLRLVSSSRVRSTTSGGEDQFCWGATAVHGCAGWALPNGEPRFQEATLWITPPLGCTHLACS